MCHFPPRKSAHKRRFLSSFDLEQSWSLISLVLNNRDKLKIVILFVVPRWTNMNFSCLKKCHFFSFGKNNGFHIWAFAVTKKLCSAKMSDVEKDKLEKPVSLVKRWHKCYFSRCSICLISSFRVGYVNVNTWTIHRKLKSQPCLQNEWNFKTKIPDGCEWWAVG